MLVSPRYHTTASVLIIGNLPSLPQDVTRLVREYFGQAYEASQEGDRDFLKRTWNIVGTNPLAASFLRVTWLAQYAGCQEADTWDAMNAKIAKIPSKDTVALLDCPSAPIADLAFPTGTTTPFVTEEQDDRLGEPVSRENPAEGFHFHLSRYFPPNLLDIPMLVPFNVVIEGRKSFFCSVLIPVDFLQDGFDCRVPLFDAKAGAWNWIFVVEMRTRHQDRFYSSLFIH